MVRSPSRFRSATARSERPMRRWISWVRPLCRPLADSRAVRVRVARGNIPYSLEIHPLPELRRNEGTVSSTEAVQITRVLPTSMRAEPSAVEMKSGVMVTGRIWSGARLSLRKIIAAILNEEASSVRGGIQLGEVSPVLADLVLQGGCQLVDVTGGEAYHAAFEHRDAVAADGIAPYLDQQSLHGLGVVLLRRHTDQVLQSSS